MDTLSYKTKSVNKETASKEWFIIDANDAVLGRLASKAAFLLRGKHKPEFTPHVDCGDNVIIINAEKISLTGNKMTSKKYIRHTGYPGGQRTRSVEELLKVKPHEVVEKSIRGMLPKNKLGRAIFKNLFVYVGEEHPHAAQKPKSLKLEDLK
jgi:large subunit ribosomal protein L13